MLTHVCCVFLFLGVSLAPGTFSATHERYTVNICLNNEWVKEQSNNLVWDISHIVLCKEEIFFPKGMYFFAG